MKSLDHYHKRFWEKVSYKILDFAASFYDLVHQTYTRFHSRPRYSKQIDTWSELTEAKVAIVIQGPVHTNDNFTLESVKIYKQHYPEASIIVSTWDKTPKVILKTMIKAGAKVVVSKLPLYPGRQNINLQVASTIAGLQLAKKTGAKFAFKIRADSRFYAPNIDSFLLNLLKSFPPKVANNKPKYRLIATSYNTFKYRPYSLNDTFMFGHIDDLIRYWSPPLDDRPRVTFALKSINDFNRANMSEQYLVSEYLKKLDLVPDWTLENSWEAYANYFLVVDGTLLDYYFAKYNPREEFHDVFYKNIQNNNLLHFRDWLNLYRNRKNIKVPKGIFKTQFGSLIKKVQ